MIMLGFAVLTDYYTRVFVAEHQLQHIFIRVLQMCSTLLTLLLYCTNYYEFKFDACAHQLMSLS